MEIQPNRETPELGEQTLWIVAGLGNPGRRYHNTRHNAGWNALDDLHERLGAPKVTRQSVVAVAETELQGVKVVLAWPTTYVNNSGGGILYAMRAFNATPSNLIVVCDDIHLVAGRIRVRRKGSDGGHNGLRSIIAATQTQRFARVRIGVGKPPSADKQIEHVLQMPQSAEQERITSGSEKAATAVEMIITSGIDEAMQKFN